MKIHFDSFQFTEAGKIQNEFERALIADRKPRTLSKENLNSDPSLSSKPSSFMFHFSKN